MSLKFRSKFSFYELLPKDVQTRSHMECRWSKMFNFENTTLIWKRIYKQQIETVYDRKLAEFNYKLLHNIVPSGYLISKWDKSVSIKCAVCNAIETTYHIYYI